ncbi:molybdopterin-guanine dinucleotide biosynthesis protein MobA [Flavobacterium hercynium]|uniref:Molybdopterin-guanine dinucleotide biosynthesis protein MobA n=2 Tax=Flavobacterium hercynium TaxID=387094 RepID=A0A226H853_9FLAO|nr:molybdopterin-guanine dinucleotide biosynthesis protein MobA [Flavobacterium hercynium]
MRFRMTIKAKGNVGIVILAAGSSSRLGSPKQILPYKNTTLLQNTIREAILVSNVQVLVVTGANREIVQNEITQTTVKSSSNPDWESGMASSIVHGLKEMLLVFPETDACIFAVCDQPYVTSTIFSQLIKTYQKNTKGIIASSYADTLGTPVLFQKKYFKELFELIGQEGAKKVINRFLDDTIAVPFEKGNIDIDTLEDYSQL